MCPERSGTHVSGMDKRGIGALERTRTSDLQVRNLMLYPLSYERAGMKLYQSQPRFEPNGSPSGPFSCILEKAR